MLAVNDNYCFKKLGRTVQWQLLRGKILLKVAPLNVIT